MEWTNEELEKLFIEVKKRSMIDEDYRKRLLEDANSAIEELAGEKLPDECKIKVIENDPAYTATLVIPDLIMDEFSADDLDAVSGGISVALIVSVCGAAVETVACAGNVCGAKGCVGYMACAGDMCGGHGGVG